MNEGSPIASFEPEVTYITSISFPGMVHFIEVSGLFLLFIEGASRTALILFYGSKVLHTSYRFAVR
jgi:hypothetical protein